MSNQDRLLSDEELEAEMYALAITFGDELMEKPRVRARVMQDIKASVALINTQKRLYAEMVVGLDDTKPSGLIANSTARNQLRAEQRARIKS